MAPATWFDRYRGKTQGRVQPVDQDPADGSYAFVLGEDAPEETAQLSTGDYTELRQVVDLTDYDFVKATLHTIGRVASPHAVAPNWARDASELFAFDFDRGVTETPNLVIPTGASAGFPLVSQGSIRYPHESYTGARKRCRSIPLNTTARSYLSGVNTPPIGTALSALSAYTLQWWWSPAFDAIAVSSGWDIDVLRLDAINASDGLRYGLRLEMRGLAGPGAHSWSPYITHYAGASSQEMSLLALYAQDPSPGWQQLTITYDASITPDSDRLSLYVDDTLVGHPATGMLIDPALPPAAGAIEYMHENGWGAWDALRLLGRAMTDTEVAASYAAATTYGLSDAIKWVQRIIIDGVVYAERTLTDAERRTWTDFCAPVRRLAGEHEIAFRLSLEDI